MVNVFKEIIRWISFLILFLPFYVSKTTFFPFIFGKIIFFQIAVGIIAVLWLILIIYNKNLRPNFKNPLILSLTIFMGILVLTSFTGVDILRSFFSTNERMTGVITFFCLYLWFLALTSLFKERGDWKKFIWASLIAAFLIGLYGLGQKLELGLGFLLKEAYTDRLSATLGNPIYLSVYLMLHIFLAAFLFSQEKNRFLKIVLFALILFNSAMMFLGGSRGAILGFAAGLFILLAFLLFLAISRISSKKTKIAVSFFLIFIIFCLGFLFFQKEKVSSIELPPEVQRALNIKPDPSRIWAWEIALKGFKEKPLLGWGWENYNIIFNKYYNPAYQIYFDTDTTWYDRSHNQILDVLCLTGIFGFLSYLAILFIIFKELFSFNKKPELLISCFILGALVVSYFVQNLFIFDTPAPLIVFYFSLGIVYHWGFQEKTREEAQKNKKKTNYIPLDEKKKFLAAFVVIIGLIFIYQANIIPYQASKLGAKGSAFSRVDLEQGLYFYEKALKFSSPYSPEIRLILAKSVMEEMGKAEPEVGQKALNFAIKEMQKNIEKHPKEVKFYLSLGKLFRANFNFDEAEKILEKALELSPTRQELYYELGQINIDKGNAKRGVDFFRKAVELNPEIINARWYYGLALILAEDFEQGIQEIELCQEKGKKLGAEPNIYAIIGVGYFGVENYTKALWFAEEALRRQSEHSTALYLKGISLFQLGEKNKAVEVLETLTPLDKELAEQLKSFMGK